MDYFKQLDDRFGRFGRIWDPFRMAIYLEDDELEALLQKFNNLEGEGYKLVEIQLPPDPNGRHWLLVVRGEEGIYIPYNDLIDLPGIGKIGGNRRIIQDRVPISSLRWYIGAHEHVVGEEITDLNNEEQQQKFEEAIAIYERAFAHTSPELVAPREEFINWIQRSANLKFIAYHFVTLRSAQNIESVEKSPVPPDLTPDTISYRLNVQ